MKRPETSISQPGYGDARGVAAQEQGKRHGHGHRWMMIACCIPMLAIAIALVVAGVVSPVFIVVAVGCTALMAMMMGGMSHGSDPSPSDEGGPSHADHDRVNRV